MERLRTNMEGLAPATPGFPQCAAADWDDGVCVSTGSMHSIQRRQFLFVGLAGHESADDRVVAVADGGGGAVDDQFSIV